MREFQLRFPDLLRTSPLYPQQLECQLPLLVPFKKGNPQQQERAGEHQPDIVFRVPQLREIALDTVR
jgi:hypothetical protein